MQNNENIDKKKKVLLNLFSAEFYRGLKRKEIILFLDIKKEQRKLFNELIDELILEKKIYVDDRGRIFLNKEIYVKGIFKATDKGFAFVETSEYEKELFVESYKTLNAFDKDVVLCRIDYFSNKENKKHEASVVKILERNTKKVVGIYKESKNFGFVICDDKKIKTDIYIDKKKNLNAKNNDKVVAEIYFYGDEKRKPEARIIEVLGNYKEKNVDILSIVKNNDLKEEFDKEIEKEVEKISLKINKKDIKNRKDFRNQLTITIDDIDAKDLDDAISLSVLEDTYKLAVHIADVSHYVKEDSNLDKEALKRATSVYLANGVIPMLPKKLSNGICSLNEKEDRLCLSVEMLFDKKGKRLDYNLYESIICVDYRMTYSDVFKILNKEDDKLSKKYSEILELLNNMNDLANLLRNERYKKGAIDFDFSESKIVLDEEGKVKEIKVRERNLATRLIEDFMIKTNEVVAEHYFWREIPFLYRVHDIPEEEKLSKLALFINNFIELGRFRKREYKSKDLQKLILSLEGKKEEVFLNKLILRAMQKAFYSSDNIGHFGLASKFYSHFTSPIRRYPDLQIHRIIKEDIKNKLSTKKIKFYKDLLKDVAKHCSEKERQAKQVELEVEKCKKCEYISSFVGEKFIGIISGVTRYGFYVELENTVEGFVRISSLKGDTYTYFEDEYKIGGDNSKKSYQIGEKVLIEVEKVSKKDMLIDFKLIRKV